MLRAVFLGCALILPALFTTAVQGQAGFSCVDPTEHVQTALARDYRPVCEAIAASLAPASHVFYPGSPEYNVDISHWVNSSTEVSACSVRPGTPEDIGVILHELTLTRTPFAIRCSGHNANPGFSSTPGVQISMIRFNDIVIHENSGTVDIGAGLTWTEVYSYLVPRGLNVVGGRLNGVGVAGFILGGGYSWKTNQYGLTIDTLTAMQIVLPNGQVKEVTEKDEDLWFALKGGLNNYGIVTRFTFKTHRQTDVWAAMVGYVGDQIRPAYTAFADFLAEDHDRRGSQLGQIFYDKGTVGFSIVLFYDGPEPPAGLYDHLLKLPNAAKSIIKGDFVNFVLSLPPPIRKRGYFDGIPMLHYTAPVLKTGIDDLQSWGDKLIKHDKDTLIFFSLDPFENDIFTHGGPSAYPPDRSRTVLPSSLYFGWNDKSHDQLMYKEMRALSHSLIEAGIKDGQDLKHAAHYTNYALYGTPLEQIYGNNVERLRKIKERYDPFRTMDLTGGFKF